MVWDIFFFSLFDSFLCQLWVFHSFRPLIIVGQSPTSLDCTESVADFSQQDVCHADLFISLAVSVAYQRN